MKATELPTFMWRDPAEAYERIESATCKGCLSLAKTRIATVTVEHCKRGKKAGVRCKHYRGANDSTGSK